MLKAFVDDSDVNSAPVYVLAGWVAPVKTWEAFSDEWAAILHMYPRIDYFKFGDAMALKGPFNGISEELRDEKLRLLVRCIEGHELLGIACVVPHLQFHSLFREGEEKNMMHNPYFAMFYGLIGRLVAYYAAKGIKDEIDFIFDEQVDQVDKVLPVWREFKEIAPPEYQGYLGHQPNFYNDKKIVALQAADLHAGWIRRLAAAELLDQAPPAPPWGNDIGTKIKQVVHFWGPDWMEDLYRRMYGYTPIRFTYTFWYGMRP